MSFPELQGKESTDDELWLVGLKSGTMVIKFEQGTTWC